MKSKTFTFLLIIITTTLSCSHRVSKDPEKWNEKELTSWFNKGGWKSGWEVSPDESMNRKELAKQIFKNPGRWKKAFYFLKNQDLNNLKPGRYELEGLDLFVNVDDYITKDEKDRSFEAHQKYADIQYVVSGEEKIGVIPLENTKVIVPYDSINDVSFLNAKENNYRLATPERFFVFFPNDAHRPSVKADNNDKVRKVVVKVRIN